MLDPRIWPNAVAGNFLFLIKCSMLPPESPPPPTCRKRRLRGAGDPHIVFYSLKMSSQRKRRVKPPQPLNIGVFNVRECCTNDVKKGEIGKMILRRRLDVCAQSETMWKR